MQHVMIDLYHCNPTLLSSEAFLRQVLDDYPDFIGMDKVSEVVLRDIKTSNPLDDGFSGFIIIATSHVSLHAWPPYGMVNLDIFSCEDFSTEAVVRFAKERFETDDAEVNTVERATRSPRISLRQMQMKLFESSSGRI
jgi:S-adenosylmethionine decarboxylase